MTADKILSIAKKEVGTTESPAGSNKCKYNTEYYGRVVSGSSYPWCCAFVWWVFREAGASKLFFDGQKTAYCPTLLNYYKKNGQIVTDYKPGDIVFFNFSGGKGASHVGICKAWDGTNITTIDGNTGNGDEANGGAVMERKRNKRHIVAVARPKYSKGENTVNVTVDVLKNGSRSENVKALQILLNGRGYSCGNADGVFGAKTLSAVKKFQTAKKLSVDGCVGAQTWQALLGE
jgi:archaellum component FlaF (FlaF/FlaG flagellin family)